MGSDPSEIWVDLVIVSHCTWWQMNFTGYLSSKTNTLTTAYHCHCWNSGVLLIQWKRCLSLDATGTKFFIMCGNADHFYNIVLWWKVASPPIPELVWMINYLACFSAEPEEFTLVILDYPTQHLKVAAHLARILVFWNSIDYLQFQSSNLFVWLTEENLQYLKLFKMNFLNDYGNIWGIVVCANTVST